MAVHVQTIHFAIFDKSHTFDQNENKRIRYIHQGTRIDLKYLRIV
jgi:hypothetical protein